MAAKVRPPQRPPSAPGHRSLLAPLRPAPPRPAPPRLAAKIDNTEAQRGKCPVRVRTQGVALACALASDDARTSTMISLSLFNPRTIQYASLQVLLFFLWLHELYSSLHTIHTTVIQVLYFLVSEKAFCPEQKCVSLYALLFCTMLAYLYQSLQTRRWSQIMFTTTTADFLRLTTTFIILRLGKGVAMSFVLITITLQFDDLEPCAPFIITTTLYFIITQFLKNPKDNILVTAVRYMDLYIFEGLEEYWIPLLMNSLAILLSIINIIIALNQDSGNIVLCMVVMYTNVIIAFQQLQEECIEPFKEQLKLLERFPLATKEQMAQRGDTTCPVCLDEMNFLTARITPCRHIFHGQCLRQCVLQYQQCPMCKQSL
ncbi:Uncharacterized protein GBIM_02235 [Gryllus bimaculatus]|nr:Uncharacterized protein GBIM_02235 [Gryllus bimaculatus]